MSLFSPVFLALTAGLLGLGALGGLIAAWIGTPLPFMLGSLIAAALVVLFAQDRFPASYRFPQALRGAFVGVIGTMIGAQVTPDLVALVPTLALSLPAILAFVLLAHVTNYQIFRRLGGYDPATAYYAGAPGGLIEAISFGEGRGADLRLLTLMQFLRIVVVVTLVPVGMSIYEGMPVGSAAGQGMQGGPTVWADLPLIAAVALGGQWLGKALRLPASALTGPLVVMGALSGAGLITLGLPPWLLALAQVVLGTGLGLRFTGMTRAIFLRGIGLSLVSVSAMMAWGVALAALVHQAGGLPFDVLVISFAPGGVTEMSLIALSLAANPAFVTFHHVVRITVTVGGMALAEKLDFPRLG